MHSSVTFISQDAFKHHNIQTLDLTNNHIETINVNAFRGLEVEESILYFVGHFENQIKKIFNLSSIVKGCF